MPKTPTELVSGYIKRISKGRDKKDILKALRLAIADIEPKVRFSQEAADELCDRMCLGETVRQIVRDEHMPTESALLHWRRNHPQFFEAFVRARVEQMSAWADEIIDLVDNCETGYKIEIALDDPKLERIEADGKVTFKFTKRHLEHAKAMAHERKWIMGKIDPEKFGDRLQVHSTVVYDDREDAELLEELRNAAEAAGVTTDMLMQMMAVTPQEDIAQ